MIIPSKAMWLYKAAKYAGWVAIVSGSLLFVASFIVAVIASPSPYDPNWIGKRWSELMLTYNIDPVYPPSEDFHVGDIFVVATFSKYDQNNHFLNAATPYFFLDEHLELQNYYNSIPVMPETEDMPKDGSIWRQRHIAEAAGAASDKSQTGGVASLKDSASMRGSNKSAVDIFSPVGHLTTLPLVAFPGLKISHASSEQIAASMPLRLLGGLWGGSRSNEDATSISIREAETYGVPEFYARDRLIRFCGIPNNRVCRANNVIDAAEETGGAVPDSVSLYFVYRVYLARSIEYTYDESTTIGAEGEVIQKLRAQTESDIESVVAASNATDKTKSSSEALTQALATLQQAEHQLDATLPGGSFSIGNANRNGVTLVQTFVRPVAIGYRAAKELVWMEPQAIQ